MSEDSSSESVESTDQTTLGMDRPAILAYGGLFTLWLVTILGGMVLTDSVAEHELVLFEDPGNVGNVGVFAVIVLLGTAVMLLALRYASMKHLRFVMCLFFGLYLGIPVVLLTDVGSLISSGALAGLPSSPVPIVIGLCAGIVMFAYPEWYVLDICAVILGALLIPMFGLGFEPLPIVVLLVVWAVYDAYAVYVSGHMTELAEGLPKLKLPFAYVIPYSLSYSMVDRNTGFNLGGGQGGSDEDSTEPETEESDTATQPASLLGLGDAIIPGMLAVSAGEFLDAPTVVPVLNANRPAIGAVVGGFFGMIALLTIVHRYEGTHAGLPPLNAGVLLGYLAGAVAAGISPTTAVGL